VISKKTKYGLKALVYLATFPVNSPVPIADISSNQGISQKFLEAILLDLKKQGFLSSKKGKGGGYYLLKPANEISVASVYRALEGPIAWLPCVSINYYEKCDDCPSEDACSINKMMLKVRDSVLEVVENQMISDM
jgi:Rrf2 family protein